MTMDIWTVFVHFIFFAVVLIVAFVVGAGGLLSLQLREGDKIWAVFYILFTVVALAGSTYLWRSKGIFWPFVFIGGAAAIVLMVFAGVFIAAGWDRWRFKKSQKI